MKKCIFNYFYNLQDKSAEQIKVLGGCKLLLIFLRITSNCMNMELLWNCSQLQISTLFKNPRSNDFKQYAVELILYTCQAMIPFYIQMNWFWESQCHRKLDGNLLLVIESCQVLEHNRKFSCWKGPAVNL